MWVWVDRLSVLVLDTSLSAAALLSLVALIMLGCRQPARRIRLARAAILCSLATIPIVAFAPLPRFEPVAALHQAGFLSTAEADTVELAPAVASIAGGPTPAGTDVAPAWRVHWPFSGRWTARTLTVVYLAGLAVGLALFV